jgi:hypothetical protein
MLKFGGYKISILDIEREHYHISVRVMVVGVGDLEYSHRGSAVVSLRHDKMLQEL